MTIPTLKITLLSILFLLFNIACLRAQQGTVGSGGVATGLGGSANYSIGQVIYIPATGTGSSAGYMITNGLEQPCAIAITAADVCTSEIQTFIQSGGVQGGVWSVSGGGTINPSTGVFTAITSGGSFTVTYSEAPPSICKGSATFLVKEIPTVTLGQDMFILYGALGYNGCRTLTPSITGGIAPFTYSWTSTDVNANGSAAASVTVCNTTDINHTYTVIVTAASGCTVTDSITLQFINISCSNNSNNVKVKICNRPQGNPGNCHTICVSANAVQALLNDGSYLGECLPLCEIPVQARTSFVRNNIPETVSGFKVTVINNPTQLYFSLLTESNTNEKVSIKITDVTGRLIDVLDNITVGQTTRIGTKYKSGVYFAEIKQAEEKAISKIDKI